MSHFSQEEHLSDHALGFLTFFWRIFWESQRWWMGKWWGERAGSEIIEWHQLDSNWAQIDRVINDKDDKSHQQYDTSGW